MRNKETEKLFNLAYTDSITGVYNRAAYEERLAKLRKNNARLENVMVVFVEYDEHFDVDEFYGKVIGDEALRAMADCLKRTVGKKADIYRLWNAYFVCIAEREIFSYVSELKDLIKFESREKIYPFSANYGYAQFNSKKHKTIDDLLLHCDQKLIEAKKRKYS